MGQVPQRMGSESERTIRSGGIELAGSLTTPAGPGPHPYIVMIGGSGPLDRDENHAAQRLDIFNRLATELAARGYGGFRYDKRGCGSSTGDFHTASFSDLVADASAAVTDIVGLSGRSSVYLLGHSEGTLVAAILAARHPQVRGLVLLSPFLEAFEPVLLRQAARIEHELQTESGWRGRLLRLWFRGRRSPLEAQRRLIARAKARGSGTLRSGLQRVPANWFREILTLDPEAIYRSVKVPVLLVGGEKDLQCDPADVGRIQSLLSSASEGHVLTDLTHVLRLDPGAPRMLDTHTLLAKPIAEDIIEIVGKWLDGQERSSIPSA